MSLFLRLLGEDDKGAALEAAVRSVATGEADARVFEVDPESFGQVPGAPFAYWVSAEIRSVFQRFPAFEAESRKALGGLKTLSDERFLRAWWEIGSGTAQGWKTIAKGGSFSRYYFELKFPVFN